MTFHLVLPKVRYALQWESKNLIAVSTAIQDWLTSRLAMELMKRGAMMTVLSSLLTALAWQAALLAATDFINSKWTIAINRSNKAGKLLAEVLLRGYQGNRPETLIGYSLGARVIFKCLQYLAKTENGAELVEKVVLLGAPIPIKDENGEAARKMVAGRFVNAYSRNDWMLGVAFRASMGWIIGSHHQINLNDIWCLETSIVEALHLQEEVWKSLIASVYDFRQRNSWNIPSMLTFRILNLLSEIQKVPITPNLVSDITIWGPAENGILSLKEAYNFYRVPIESVCGLPSYGPKWFFLGCIWVGVWLNYY
ncbi:hypothetical protein JHK85_048138 [Glycine max]|nr:hypothetical protein JHK85_048138 [Glycine max]